MKKQSRIYVAGHRGLVGSAICRALESEGHENLITASSSELDLRDQQATRAFFDREQPEFVFLAAARVGGILANDVRSAEFIYDNLMIQANVIHNAHRCGVDKLLFLGSTCIYPKLARQPMNEDQLLSGPLEPTNDAYAVAKIAGIKMCQSYWKQYGCHFISAMPTNLYGPNDNFDLASSHVLPALVRKFHEAVRDGDSSVVVWGTGTPRREFCHVDDAASACLFLMRHYDRPDIINIGVGEDISIMALAQLVAAVVGFDGKIEQDLSKPDGTPRKLVDVSRLFALGWRPAITLEQGLRSTYRWYLDNDG